MFYLVMFSSQKQAVAERDINSHNMAPQATSKTLGPKKFHA